jgi:O-antigen biosynthesis protein WbqV
VSVELALSKLGRMIDRMVASSLRTMRAAIRSSMRNESRKGPHEKFQIMTSPYIILIFDSFVAFLSIFISIHLRIGMDFLDYSPSYIIKNMIVFGLVSSSVFLWLQTYQSFWRYTSIEDMIPIFLSVILSNMLFFPLMILMNQEDFLPYSVLIINVFVQNIMLLIPRFLAKTMYNQKLKRLKETSNFTKKSNQQIDMPQILLLGTNNSVEVFLREVVINEDISFNFTPIGILTLNSDDVGHTIKGIPIVGEVKSLGKVLKEMRDRNIFPKQIVVTEKSIPESMKHFLMEYVRDHGLLLIHVIHQCTFSPISE